jgi:hypothetical protein
MQPLGVPSAQSANAFMEGTEYLLLESGIRGLISNGMQAFMPGHLKANVFRPDFEVTYSLFSKYGGGTDAGLRHTLDFWPWAILLLKTRKVVQINEGR